MSTLFCLRNDKSKYQINLNTMEHVAAKTLKLNVIGVANVITERAIPLTIYAKNRALGGFILIDKLANATVGDDLINFALRRSQNIYIGRPWTLRKITIRKCKTRNQQCCGCRSYRGR